MNRFNRIDISQTRQGDVANFELNKGGIWKLGMQNKSPMTQ